jgi:hypothetical protein
MNRFLVMLAAFDPEAQAAAQTHISDPRLYAMFAMLGALAFAVVIACVVAIVYALKKKRRKPRQRHHFRTKAGSGNETRAAEPSEGVKVKKKWRKPRRPHRPLNPTLAQVGGLPPARDENTPLPPMP